MMEAAHQAWGFPASTRACSECEYFSHSAQGCALLRLSQAAIILILLTNSEMCSHY